MDKLIEGLIEKPQTPITRSKLINYVDKSKWNVKSGATKPRTGKARGSLREREYYACVDPNTNQLMRIYDGQKDLKYFLNPVGFEGKMRNYFKDENITDGKNTIAGFIIVRLKRHEIEKETFEQLNKHVQDKAIDRLICVKMDRIKKHLNAYTFEEKEKISQLLTEIENMD